MADDWFDRTRMLRFKVYIAIDAVGTVVLASMGQWVMAGITFATGLAFLLYIWSQRPATSIEKALQEFTTNDEGP